jgi:hypothetical protein
LKELDIKLISPQKGIDELLRIDYTPPYIEKMQIRYDNTYSPTINIPTNIKYTSIEDYYYNDRYSSQINKQYSNITICDNGYHHPYLENLVDDDGDSREYYYAKVTDILFTPSKLSK